MPTAAASAGPSGHALAVEGLFAGYRGVPVVRELDLEVRPGEVVALLGPNGAGKTTTLETIAGLRRAGAFQRHLDTQTAGAGPDFGDRVPRTGVDGLVPQGCSPLEPFAAAHHDHVRCSDHCGALGDQQPHYACPENGSVRTWPDLSPVDSMHGNRRAVAHGSQVITHAVRDVDKALDRLDDVAGVSARLVVPVLTVHGRPSVVVTELVVPELALAAVATASMRGPGYSVADLPPELLRVLPKGHDVAGPLMSWREGQGRRPESGEVAVEDMRVGAADRHCADLA
jgi:energy-coupling factor transporter ATP-binding protein EcfA2